MEKQFGSFFDRVKRGVVLYEYEGEDPQFEWGVDVTDVVVSVLGDIVSSALWIISSGYSEKSMLEDAKYWEECVNKCLEQKTVNFDGDEVLIQFTNGKELVLWNSEWGGIRKRGPKDWDAKTIENEKESYPAKATYGEG